MAKVTLESLAVMVQKGFAEVHEKMDKGFAEVNKEFKEVHHELAEVRADLAEFKTHAGAAIANLSGRTAVLEHKVGID